MFQIAYDDDDGQEYGLMHVVRSTGLYDHDPRERALLPW